MALTDHPSAPFSLEVQLNVDDYRRYFAIVGKRESGFSNAMIFVVALFLAIAIAFLFRTLASLETQYPAAIELVGRYSLLAYLVGVLVFLVVGSIMRRRSIGRILAGTPHAFDSKTIVLDTDAVSITGKLSEVRWTWPAITQLTATKGLLCLWIGSQNAVIIPERAFATDEARKSAIAFIAGRIAAAKPAA